MEALNQATPSGLPYSSPREQITCKTMAKAVDLMVVYADDAAVGSILPSAIFFNAFLQVRLLACLIMNATASNTVVSIEGDY
jgi:hypothetical protein